MVTNNLLSSILLGFLPKDRLPPSQDGIYVGANWGPLNGSNPNQDTTCIRRTAKLEFRKIFFFQKLFVLLVVPKILEFHKKNSIGVTPMTSGSQKEVRLYDWPTGVQRYELLKLSCKIFKNRNVRCFAVYKYI